MTVLFSETGQNPIKGEARAARLVCLSAKEFNGMSVILEGDYLELICQVNDRNLIPNWEIVGEVETIRSLLAIHPEWDSFS